MYFFLFIFLFFCVYPGVVQSTILIQKESSGTEMLVIYAPLTGSCTDQSGNGNNCSLFGSATFGTAPWGGLALQCNGSDGRAEFPGDSSYINLDSYTIMACTYPSSYGEGGRGRVVNWEGPGGTTLVRVRVNDTNTRYDFDEARHETNDGTWVTNNGTVQLNQTRHVTFTYDRASLTAGVFLDGVPVQITETDSPSGPFNQTTVKLNLCNRTADDGTFHGFIDKFRMFDGVLNASQILSFASNDCEVAPAGPQLAFPTAEGAGRFASGGRGATGGSCTGNNPCHGVYKVVNLNDSGPGSLRACIEDDAGIGARNCVFDTSGMIVLNTSNPIRATAGQGNITIAWQTAPAPGVLVQGKILFEDDAGNAIIRHCRIRPGTEQIPRVNGQALAFWDQTEDVMIDHCSMGWATDDTVLVLHKATVQHSILAEGFFYVDNGNNTSKGGLACGSTIPECDATYFKNAYVHLNKRFPEVQGGSTLSVINNVIYNSGLTLVYPIRPPSGPVQIAWAGNYFRPGPRNGGVGGSSPRIKELNDGCTLCDETTSYYGDNIHETSRPTNTGPEDTFVDRSTGGGFTLTGTRFADAPVLTTETTDAFVAYNEVLANVGARVPTQEQWDADLITDIINRTGPTGDETIPPGVAGYGGYPTLAVNTRAAGFDTDDDGIPNTWEIAQGLNPNDGTDGPQIHSNGYSNFENYINDLAGDAVPGINP